MTDTPLAQQIEQAIVTELRHHGEDITTAELAKALVCEILPLLAAREQAHAEGLAELRDANAALARLGELSKAKESLVLHRCKVCGARWLLWDQGLWNLLDQHQRPGPCCDNAPMGDQIEFVRDIIPRRQ